MKNFSHFLSFIFSPLLVTTYGVALALWFSTLVYVPLVVKLQVLGVVFLINAVLPGTAIFAMKKMGMVGDFGLNSRADRPVPYSIVCICYLATAYIFSSWHMPEWMVLFMVGGAAAVVVSMIVNMWWKISAHLAGMGGAIGMMLRIYAENAESGYDTFWALMTVTIMAGLVASARVYLGRHTVGQVIAGALNGALCVYIISGF